MSSQSITNLPFGQLLYIHTLNDPKAIAKNLLALPDEAQKLIQKKISALATEHASNAVHNIKRAIEELAKDAFDKLSEEKPNEFKEVPADRVRKLARTFSNSYEISVYLKEHPKFLLQSLDAAAAPFPLEDERLEEHLLLRIFKFVGAQGSIQMGKTCKKFLHLPNTPQLWDALGIKDLRQQQSKILAKYNITVPQKHLDFPLRLGKIARLVDETEEGGVAILSTLEKVTFDNLLEIAQKEEFPRIECDNGFAIVRSSYRVEGEPGLYAMSCGVMKGTREKDYHHQRYQLQKFKMRELKVADALSLTLFTYLSSPPEKRTYLFPDDEVSPTMTYCTQPFNPVFDKETIQHLFGFGREEVNIALGSFYSESLFISTDFAARNKLIGMAGKVNLV